MILFGQMLFRSCLRKYIFGGWFCHVKHFWVGVPAINDSVVIELGLSSLHDYVKPVTVGGNRDSQYNCQSVSCFVLQPRNRNAIRSWRMNFVRDWKNVINKLVYLAHSRHAYVHLEKTEYISQCFVLNWNCHRDNFV